MRKIQKLLVANRSEIAIRVFRAANAERVEYEQERAGHGFRSSAAPGVCAVRCWSDRASREAIAGDFLDGLTRGVAAHHAGLLPTFKQVVEQLFVRGLQFGLVIAMGAIGLRSSCASMAMNSLMRRPSTSSEPCAIRRTHSTSRARSPRTRSVPSWATSPRPCTPWPEGAREPSRCALSSGRPSCGCGWCAPGPRRSIPLKSLILAVNMKAASEYAEIAGLQKHTWRWASSPSASSRRSTCRCLGTTKWRT